MSDTVSDELVSTLKRWVADEVVPVASRYEHADEFPAPLVEQMKAFGLFGATIPEEFGGLGLDSLTYARLMEELAFGWMSLSGIINTHTIVVSLIKRAGTDEQKQRWLPRMATGEVRGAFSLSEPDAGSDTQAIRCAATPDGDFYRIDGTKTWVTNGERAGILALAARTAEGITCFIVEKDPGPAFEGISVTAPSTSSATRASRPSRWPTPATRCRRPTCSVAPSSSAAGLPTILGSLELGRVNIAARASGVARAAFEASLRYATERETFGKPIAAHQAIQFKLADMATKVEAARLLTHSAARRFDAGERADVEAGMAKLFASETALEVATEAMRIHGGYGYTKDVGDRAVLPRRPADDHRRGHERDPAHGDRAGTSQALLRFMTSSTVS